MTQMTEQKVRLEIVKRLMYLLGECGQTKTVDLPPHVRSLTQLFNQAGYVQLDEDQGLPRNPHICGQVESFVAWDRCQRDMLNSNFRRIRRE